MAKINSFYKENDIAFELDFTDTDGFFYYKDKPDYMSWIPCDVKVITREEECTFLVSPTLSLEGIKMLFNKLDALMVNRDKVGYGLTYTDDIEIFKYTATEGEFEISFKNTIDEEKLVEVIIWMEAECCNTKAGNYGKGYRFYTRLSQLEVFEKELKDRLFKLTDGKEGKKK